MFLFIFSLAPDITHAFVRDAELGGRPTRNARFSCSVFERRRARSAVFLGGRTFRCSWCRPSAASWWSSDSTGRRARDRAPARRSPRQNWVSGGRGARRTGSGRRNWGGAGKTGVGRAEPGPGRAELGRGRRNCNWVGAGRTGAG